MIFCLCRVHIYSLLRNYRSRIEQLSVASNVDIIFSVNANFTHASSNHKKVASRGFAFTKNRGMARGRGKRRNNFGKDNRRPTCKFSPSIVECYFRFNQDFTAQNNNTSASVFIASSENDIELDTFYHWRSFRRWEIEKGYAWWVWSLISKLLHLYHTYQILRSLVINGCIKSSKRLIEVWRMVATGYHQAAGIDFRETFSPFVKLCIIQAVLSIAVMNNWEVMKVDFE